MKKVTFLLPLLLFACSHGDTDRTEEEAAAVAVLPAPAVDESLITVGREIDSVNNQLRGAESRRDNFRLQATADPNKESAVDGAEAEIATLEAKRARLEHRRHLLEGRKRELDKDKTDQADYILDR